MHPFVIDAQGRHLRRSRLGDELLPGREPHAESSPGDQPCTELETRGGIWRYDANKTGQHFSPARALRHRHPQRRGHALRCVGPSVRHAARPRPALAELAATSTTPEQGAELPAEELVELQQGGDYGWPECYFDGLQKKLVLAPEYGGDGGKTVGVCADKKAPGRVLSRAIGRRTIS